MTDPALQHAVTAARALGPYTRARAWRVLDGPIASHLALQARRVVDA